MPFEFLVVGVGRGGTSLLAGMLDYHPRLKVDFEHAAKAILVFGNRGLESGRVEACSTAFRDACEARAALHQDKIYGNKITTEQLLALAGPLLKHRTDPDLLRFFFDDAMAGRKLVFVVRDGRTCVRSKVNRTAMPVEQACGLWRYGVSVLRYLNQQGERVHVVRYEHLVREPERELSAVCGFLGVPFDPDMMRGAESPQMQPVYRQGEVDVSKLSLEGVPPQVTALLETELQELGYLNSPA